MADYRVQIAPRNLSASALEATLPAHLLVEADSREEAVALVRARLSAEHGEQLPELALRAVLLP